MLIGTGRVNINADSIDEVLTRIYSLNNTSKFLVSKRIADIKQLKKTDLTDLTDVQVMEKSDNDLFKKVKSNYIIKNIVGVISNMPKMLDKKICLIYLFYNKVGYKNSDIMKLSTNSDFDYINSDNEKLNALIDLIIVDFNNYPKYFEDYVKSVDDRTAFYLKQLVEWYTLVDLLTINSTDRFYVRLSRNSNNFGPEDKRLLSEHLKKIKHHYKKNSITSLNYFLLKFGVTPMEWKDFGVTKKSLAPLIKISANNLLNII